MTPQEVLLALRCHQSAIETGRCPKEQSQMYEVTTCPLCGQLMFNGECENPDCRYHWHPMEDDE